MVLASKKAYMAATSPERPPSFVAVEYRKRKKKEKRHILFQHSIAVRLYYKTKAN